MLKIADYKKSDCIVIFHCCGAIYDLIPDLINAGVDILNPIQINAKNMDLVKLKTEYGKDITFWGVGCDTITLTTEGPDKVKEKVERNIRILGKGGGCVFAPIHNITARSIQGMRSASESY